MFAIVHRQQAFYTLVLVCCAIAFCVPQDRLDVHRGAAGSEAVADDMSTADTDADADEQQQQQEEGQDADDGVSTAEGSHALVEERGSEQGDGGSGDASIPESVGGSSASAV